MRVLLINQNPMIEKLVRNAANKLNMDISNVGVISDSLNLREFTCIICDDESVGSKLNLLKNAQSEGVHVCLLHNKNNTLVSKNHFKMSVQKPFLPTEILEILTRSIPEDTQEVKKDDNLDLDENIGELIKKASSDLSKDDPDQRDEEVDDLESLLSADIGLNDSNPSKEDERDDDILDFGSLDMDDLDNLDSDQNSNQDGPIEDGLETDQKDLNIEDKVLDNDLAGDSLDVNNEKLDDGVDIASDIDLQSGDVDDRRNLDDLDSQFKDDNVEALAQDESSATLSRDHDNLKDFDIDLDNLKIKDSNKSPVITNEKKSKEIDEYDISEYIDNGMRTPDAIKEGVKDNINNIDASELNIEDFEELELSDSDRKDLESKVDQKDLNEDIQNPDNEANIDDFPELFLDNEDSDSKDDVIDFKQTKPVERVEDKNQSEVLEYNLEDLPINDVEVDQAEKIREEDGSIMDKSELLNHSILGEMNDILKQTQSGDGGDIDIENVIGATELDDNEDKKGNLEDTLDDNILKDEILEDDVYSEQPYDYEMNNSEEALESSDEISSSESEDSFDLDELEHQDDVKSDIMANTLEGRQKNTLESLSELEIAEALGENELTKELTLNKELEDQGNDIEIDDNLDMEKDLDYDGIIPISDSEMRLPSEIEEMSDVEKINLEDDTKDLNDHLNHTNDVNIDSASLQESEGIDKESLLVNIFNNLSSEKIREIFDGVEIKISFNFKKD